MLEVIFLIALGIIWIAFASVQDLKSREVANWLSFSLIVFALGFRFFWSLFSESANGFMFFYQGLIGLGIFFLIGNLFYYSRLFAGGDAKLMIALGSVLSFSDNFYVNLKIYFVFLFVFLFAGMFYGLFWSLSLMIKNFKNFKKEFYKIYKKNKGIILSLTFFGILILALGFIDLIFSFFGILILTVSYFYVYAKAVDESCMIKKARVSELVEGDWLYKDIKIGDKLLKASWEGLSKEQIREIKKKHKFVLIRQGIPFVPVFLIAFLILIFVWFYKMNLGFCFLS